MKKGSKTNQILAERIMKNRQRLSEWAMEHAYQAPPPFYSSIDLRDSGFKTVPVDCNLYPAGFNNICPEDLRTAPPIFRAEVDAEFARMNRDAPKKVLILPESHTQNTYYLENVYFLKKIIEQAGFDTRVGWYNPLPEGTSNVLKTASQKNIEVHPIKIENGILSTDGFSPEMILLNNDFSGGYPKPLDQVSQPIVPSHRLGWHSRKKSTHFQYYNGLAKEFATIIDVDPWLIQIDTEVVEPVNFNEEEGVENVAQAVEQMIERTKKAYESHQISEKPFVFVKNNSGTYGMGIMVVHSADELRQMNRRTKNKMSMGKNHRPIDSVVIQEGIKTATRVEARSAEPVIYLFGGETIGGFLRTNPEKSDEENLNAPGMVFKKLCMSDLRDEGNEPTLELVYGWTARLSALAAGRELAGK